MEKNILYSIPHHIYTKNIHKYYLKSWIHGMLLDQITDLVKTHLLITHNHKLEHRQSVQGSYIKFAIYLEPLYSLQNQVYFPCHSLKTTVLWDHMVQWLLYWFILTQVSLYFGNLQVIPQSCAKHSLLSKDHSYNQLFLSVLHWVATLSICPRQAADMKLFFYSTWQ